MFQLVVAVGNPGSEYASTRHNVAWMFFEQSKAFEGTDWKAKFKGLYTETTIKGQKIWALMPQTFMNLSGESVQPMAAFFKVPPEKILVIHDELDILFGQVHFKMGGGFAGHNGLKSIAACLGTDQFARMRIGIGRPPHGNVSGWVLSPFSKEEAAQIPLLMEKLNDPFVMAMVDGLSKVGIYNKKNLLA